MDVDDPDDPVAISDDEQMYTEPDIVELDKNPPAKAALSEDSPPFAEEGTEGTAFKSGVVASATSRDKDPEKDNNDGCEIKSAEMENNTEMAGPAPSSSDSITDSLHQTEARTSKTTSEQVQKTSDIACVTLDSDSDEAVPGQESSQHSAVPPERMKPPRRCINPDCHSRQDLLAATSGDLSYLRMVHGEQSKLAHQIRLHRRRLKVCRTCHSLVDNYQQGMARLLKEGDPLLEGAVRQRQDEVCLDSDGENEKDVQEADDDESSDSGDSVASELEVDGDLAVDIQEAMEAVQFEEQLEKCLHWLQGKQAHIDDSFSKTECDLARLEKDVSLLYEDLYRERPPTKSTPPVDIYHTHSQRTIRYPDGRVYDLDPAWTAHHQPGAGHGMPPPPAQPRPPPLLAKPGVLVRRRAAAGGPAGDALPVRREPPLQGTPPPDRPPVDVLISDVVAVAHARAAPPDLPPLGSIVRAPLRPGDMVFAMHSDQLSPWFRAKVRDVTIRLGMTRCRIKFETPRVVNNKNRISEGTELAYMEPASVRLHVGVRVVAAYRDFDSQTPTFYSGTVAEAPKTMNGYRYLVFFDDGYAAYVRHNELKLIVQPSKNVAEDVHEDCRQFVAKYLAQFPERPMVKLQPGQVVKTELAGRWLPARVQAVDASLVKMIFETERPPNTEWIYRGSTRLAPMYAELVLTQPRRLGTGAARRNIQNTVNVGKKNRVYVEYTRHADRGDAGSDDASRPRPRAVARKSTGMSTSVAATGASSGSSAMLEPEPSDRLISPISPMEGAGQIEEISNKPRVTPKRLQPHSCSRACVRNFNVDMDQLKGNNPLIMPMMSGWIREIVRHRTSKRTVLYRAPCGRRLRSLAEVFRYLQRTGCQLQIDCFCFDFWVHCFTEFVPAKSRTFCSIKDISYGKENVPVSCVNSLDRDYPDYVEYSTRRIPTPGVHLNLDPEFLTCCDCTDDCQDRERCPCWQATIQGTEFGPTGHVDPHAGYQYRRLINGNVITGIYECNEGCRCRRTCLNRVVQHPLRLRLQVFKTLRRGWGIRCLDDIPKGGFICVYAGQLLTESGANEDGKNYGDEYLAELDYIEVLERLKEGYESDVVDDDESQDEKADEEKSDAEDASNGSDTADGAERDSDGTTGRRGRAQDGDFVLPAGRRPAAGDAPADLRRSNRARQSKADADKDKEEKEKQAKKKSAAKTVETKKTITPEKPSGKDKSSRLTLPDENYTSVREQFGADEYCYIMDAKNIGNLGRYLNHCCSPNVFVQNVFVDTHDLRFPWVAFFALSYIRAGSELTWDYNYEVGSVPGKVMYCHCGSQECRGRLL